MPRLLLPAGAIALATVLSLTFAFSPLSTSPAVAAGYCPAANLEFDEEEQRFLALLNEYRVAHGLAPLEPDEGLNRAASYLAQEMAQRRYVSHTDALGRGLGPRLADCGVGFSFAGENVLAGTFMDSAEEALLAWRSSPSHNANMLNPNFRFAGVARYYDPSSPYGWYWVTDFSAPRWW